MEKMFYGMEGSGTDKKLGGVDGVDFILISAASLYNGKKFKSFNPPAHKELFLDSGGFSFFNKEGDYPFSVQEYVDLAREIRADYVSVLDYPCEPDVVRANGKRSNIERIEATISNAKECLKYGDLNWVMIVQGYTETEYQYSCDQIREEGLETKIIAIGTLCARKKVREAKRVISLVRRNFPNALLHGFGVDLRFIKDLKIRGMLWSADTQAWKWNNYGEGDHILPKSEADKLLNYPFYRERVEQFIRNNGQSVLSVGGL